MDVLNGGSLRVRNSSYAALSDCCKGKVTTEVRGCPSVMSPETKRLLPPNTETVQTKPFPIRGKQIPVVFFLGDCIPGMFMFHVSMLTSMRTHFKTTWLAVNVFVIKQRHDNLKQAVERPQ